MDFTLAIRIVLMFICKWIFLLVPVFLMYKNKEKLRDIGFTKGKILLQILVGILIAIALCLVFTVIPILLGQRDMISSTRFSQVWQFIFQFFYAIFGIALVEVFFFRGYLFKKLLGFKDPKLLAILVSSLIFGLFHYKTTWPCSAKRLAQDRQALRVKNIDMGILDNAVRFLSSCVEGWGNIEFGTHQTIQAPKRKDVAAEGLFSYRQGKAKRPFRSVRLCRQA